MEEEKKQPESVEVETAPEVENVQAEPVVATETVQSPYKNGLLKGLDNFYGVTKAKSSIKTEMLAGVATFLAMCYILVVNPNSILYSNALPLWPSVFLATAFGAIIGTLLMSVVAKMPYAQAPGMGLNSMVGTLIGGGVGAWSGYQFSFGNAMLLVLISGLIFLLLSVIPGGRNKETGKLVSLREYIFNGIPKGIRTAIPVGIGLFIAYIGFQNAGIIVTNGYTQVGLVGFNIYVPQLVNWA
ncbi:MAG: NCS2 family permease, partial [Clostridia bacterium]|nr:NCS2 family permease [Clostridia bacterium]